MDNNIVRYTNWLSSLSDIQVSYGRVGSSPTLTNTHILDLAVEKTKMIFPKFLVSVCYFKTGKKKKEDQC